MQKRLYSYQQTEEVRPNRPISSNIFTSVSPNIMNIKMKLLFLLIKLPLGDSCNIDTVNAEIYGTSWVKYRLCLLT